MSPVTCFVEGFVGHVILSRPERRNALDRIAAVALRDAVLSHDSDPAIRVVKVAAYGEDFCAGADLHALLRLIDADYAAQEEDARALGMAFLALCECSKPTVAVVRGRALAGGAALASACDLVLAEEGAQFGYPEVQFGFVAAMAIPLLLRSTSRNVAFDLVSSGRRIGADEAYRIGLVTRVIPVENFDEEVGRVLQSLATTPPGALAATKRVINSNAGPDISTAIERGIIANARARMTEEFREGVLRVTKSLRS